MCDCPVCLDSRHFRAELAKLPVEHQSDFEEFYDSLLHVEMDADYYRAVLDGSWPSAQQVLDRFHTVPASSDRISVAQTELTGVNAAIDCLPEESQPYFRHLAQRAIDTYVQHASLKNIVYNAIPNAHELLAQFRKPAGTATA